LAAARASGDLGSLIASVPYSTFLGFGIERVDGEIRGVMRYREHLVGNAALPALHGGALAGLLETTAIAKVLWEEEPLVLPRPVTLTFEYLRPARPADVWAAADIVRRGRRVCSVRARAWQDDRAKPVVTASATLLLS
jgi:uncharacterized protein (TIGR00369 family)